MTRRVIWLEAATAQLARAYVPLWITAEGRAITTAVAELDLKLSRNAEQQGESRNGLVRLVVQPPLWVYFEIQDELVIVTELHYHPPRRL